MAPMESGSQSRLAAMSAIFGPTSVAIVGASNDPHRVGGRPIAFCLERGFEGSLYPVNPHRETVQGLHCYPDIGSIPKPIDVAIVALPASQVPDAVEAAARKGARAAIVLSSGFAELGEGGLALEARMLAGARRADIHVLGPNCLGAYNAANGFAGTFASFLQEDPCSDGGVALVSQSGAYNTYLYMLARRRGIRVGRWISTGNESDLQVSDAIEYLADDSGVRVIGCVIEGVTDGRRLLASIDLARRRGKPVIILKMARSAGGVEAAASHTAALAVDDAVFDAAVRQSGAIRVGSTDDLLDLLYAFNMASPPSGNRLGIISVSGGAGVLMADAADEAGLLLPRLAATTQAALKSANPLGSFANPVDLTGAALNDPALIEQPLRAILSEPGLDMAAGFFLNWVAAPVIGEQICAVMIGAAQSHPDRVFALVVTAPEPIVATLEAAGILVFTDPGRAIAALGALSRLGRSSNAEPASTSDMPRVPSGSLTEVASKDFLASAGFRLLAEYRVETPDQAAAAAEDLESPVALKIVSANLPHKTDVGGVALGLTGGAAVRAAAAQMLDHVAKVRPDARIEGFLVSPMVPEGVEMIVAARMDPTFGPIVMVGMGGVYVEVLRDFSIRVGPIGPDEARCMIDELGARRLLEGLRGAQASDIEALAEAVSLLSRLGAANDGHFSDIEINPLRLGARGEGYAILDALVTPADEAVPC